MPVSRLLAVVLVLLLTNGAASSATAPGHLDLEKLVEEALQRHPILGRARSAATASEHVPSQVGSLPDPMLTMSSQNIRVDDPALDGSPMSAIQIGVEQVFPFPGKLARREAAAAATTSIADREVVRMESLVRERVERAYWDLAYAESAERITREAVDVIDTLVNVAHVRLSVGQSAQQDVLQAQAAHSKLRSELEARVEAVTVARRSLNSAIGRPPDADVGGSAAWPDGTEALDRVLLRGIAERANPDVAVARERVRAAELSLDEASFDRRPDFKVALAYRYRDSVLGDMTDGADMVTATVGITLPIWMKRKQGARVLEETERLAAALANQEAVSLDSMTALERALDEIDRLDAEIRLHRSEVVPQADEALDASIADYQVAKVGFVSVLQNWRGWLDAKLALEARLRERFQRAAEIEALVGSSEGDSR